MHGDSVSHSVVQREVCTHYRDLHIAVCDYLNESTVGTFFTSAVFWTVTMHDKFDIKKKRKRKKLKSCARRLMTDTEAALKAPVLFHLGPSWSSPGHVVSDRKSVV